MALVYRVLCRFLIGCCYVINFWAQVKINQKRCREIFGIVWSVYVGMKLNRKLMCFLLKSVLV